jgi:predicted permease
VLQVWQARETVTRALRRLRRSPYYTVYAVVTIGTALGFTTTVFAWIDTVTHPVSPYREVDRLYTVSFDHGDARNRPPTSAILEALRGVQSIEGAVASVEVSSRSEIELDNQTITGTARWVSPHFFNVLGIGTSNAAFDSPDSSDNESVALMDSSTWMKYFANRAELGRTAVTVRGEAVRVVGLTASHIEIPDWNGLWISARTDQWLDRTGSQALVYVRAASGVSRAALVGRLNTVTQQLTLGYSRPTAPFALRVRSLKQDPLGWQGFQVAFLLAPATILAIACANVAALLLLRGAERRGDYALRLALGATHTSLVTDVLAEVFCIAIVGGVGGLIVGQWGLGLLTASLPPELVSLGIADIHWSPRVLFATTIALAMTLLTAGVLPALHIIRIQPFEQLKESAGSIVRAGVPQLRAIVAVALALSMALLYAGLLTLKSSRKVEGFDLGYDARGLLALRVLQGRTASAASSSTGDFARVAAEKARAVDGVLDATLLEHRATERDLVVSDDPASLRHPLDLGLGYYNVDEAFFETLRIRTIRGRTFEPGDQAGEGAAVLDSVAAAQLYGGANPIGRRIKLGGPTFAAPWLRVVGVVQRVQLRLPADPDLADPPRIYTSAPGDAAPTSEREWILIARPKSASVAPTAAVGIRRALAGTLPHGALILEEEWSRIPRAASGSRTLALVFGVLALVSLLLGAIGLFSVVAYDVRQRRREFAIRTALGATKSDLVRIVLRHGLVPVLGGAAAGAFLGMGAAYLLYWNLFGVYPADAPSLLIAETLLVTVGLVACGFPAAGALRYESSAVLRGE